MRLRSTWGAMVYQQINAAAGQLDIPVWSRNSASRHDMDVQAESCQKWPHPFSDEQTPWLAARAQGGIAGGIASIYCVLVCGKNSDVGTRGRLVVGVRGGHLKKGDGQRPCSIYGQKTRCPVVSHTWGTVSSPCWRRLTEGGQRRDLDAKRLFFWETWSTKLHRWKDGRWNGKTTSQTPSLGLGRHLESRLSAGVAGCRNEIGGD